MPHHISDETIEHIGILSKLALSGEEKKSAGKDMEEMLDFIDKISELETEGIEPMTHIHVRSNVFREDIVTNEDDNVTMLKNAPVQENGMYQVPRTF